MITKGYDFKDLTLVGVLDADASLSGGNFKAVEKTYQLLTQVAGRAGRREDKGKCFIQSYNSDNLIMEALKNNDSASILNFEKENRKLIELPPFGKMCLLVITAAKEKDAYDKIREIATLFPNNNNIELLGPSPVGIYKMNNQFRFKLIVKTSNNINLQKLVKNVIEKIKLNNNIKLKIDVNPYNIP